MSDVTRRRVLQATAGGLTALSMPGFLAACAKDGAVAAATGDLPTDPFLTWFGVDGAVIRRVLAELGARGADHGELDFQHRRSSSLSMEDGRIGQAHTSVDQGVGLRVVVGYQVGYACTEDLTEAAMTEAARTAAAIARGTPRPAPTDLTPHGLGDRYQLAVPWSDVAIADKLDLVRRTEAIARGKDPAIEKVSVRLRDGEERVLVADMRGNLVVDDRPSSQIAPRNTLRADTHHASGEGLAARFGRSEPAIRDPQGLYRPNWCPHPQRTRGSSASEPSLGGLESRPIHLPRSPPPQRPRSDPGGECSAPPTPPRQFGLRRTPPPELPTSSSRGGALPPPELPAAVGPQTSPPPDRTAVQPTC